MCQSSLRCGGALKVDVARYRQRVLQLAFTACMLSKFYKAQVNVRCALGAKFQSRREILKCKRSRNRAVLKFKN